MSLGMAAAACAPLRAQDPLDSLAILSLEAPVRQHLFLESSYRRWTVGTLRSTEADLGLTYVVSGSRLRFRLQGTGFRFRQDTVAFTGAVPVAARLDYAPRYGDTLSVYGNTPGAPAGLSSTRLAALGAAGAPIVDFGAFRSASAAMVGVRGAFAWPVGPVVLRARGAAEVEPRPGGTEAVTWRQATLRGGLGATVAVGRSRLTLNGDVAWSSADSLDGRNLFPGGGSVLTSLDLGAPLGAAGHRLDASLYYVRPFDNVRNDQPNRLIPVGDAMGASADVALALGGILLAPSLDLIRESSRADLSRTVLGTTLRQELRASSWGARVSLAAIIPVLAWLDLTPEIGAAGGNARATLTNTLAPTPRRQRPLVVSRGFDDDVTGWFGGVVVGVSW